MSRGARFLRQLHNKLRAKNVLSRSVKNAGILGYFGVEVGPVTDSVSIESDNFCELLSAALCVSLRYSALKALVDAETAEDRRERRKKERMEASLHPLEVADCLSN